MRAAAVVLHRDRVLAEKRLGEFPAGANEPLLAWAHRHDGAVGVKALHLLEGGKIGRGKEQGRGMAVGLCVVLRVCHRNEALRDVSRGAALDVGDSDEGIARRRYRLRRLQHAVVCRLVDLGGDLRRVIKHHRHRVAVPRAEVERLPPDVRKRTDELVQNTDQLQYKLVK